MVPLLASTATSVSSLMRAYRSRAPSTRMVTSAASTSLKISMSLVMLRNTGQPGDSLLGVGALEAVAHRAGQPDVAVAGAGFDAAGHGDILRERVVGGRDQHRVVAVVAGRQHDHQVVVHAGHALDPPGRRGCLPVLRVAGHGPVERDVAVHVLHG